MHSTLWASIFASAVVAVVTTLLVEYLAKPGLEARKERILESKRERRTALKNIDRATYLAGRIIAVEVGGLDPCTGQESPRQLEYPYSVSIALPSDVVARQCVQSLPDFRVPGLW